MIPHPSNVKEDEGWTYLVNSPKWHYFRDGRSLCRKFLLLGRPELECDGPESADDCKKCRQLRNKEQDKKSIDRREQGA